MTLLAKTALDFCCEVFGWGSVFGPSPVNSNALCGGSFTEYHTFDPTDLNAVMAAVQKWCDKAEGAVELSYYGYLPGEWQVGVSTAASVEEIAHSDLRHALLAACVEASRKPKAET